MAALAWPAPRRLTEGGGAGGRRPPGASRLSVVGSEAAALPLPVEDDEDVACGGVPFLTVVPDRFRVVTDPVGARAPRRRVSAAVRRRRLLFALGILLVVGLALPLGGTGGRSHAAGPTLAATGHTVEYTVHPGDTLWSIAERADPTGDPRVLVARMAAETGSDTVQPGEHIAVP